MKSLRYLLTLCAVLLAWSIRAEVQLPAFIASGMVLQQQTTVRLWGKTESGEKVTLTTSWDNKTYSAKPVANGSWAVKVKTPTAGGPYEIRINDGDEIVLQDVLIGEVWIAAGQSNMEMPMKGFQSQPVENSLDLILSSENEQVRLFMTKRTAAKEPMSTMVGSWKEASVASTPDFSATAYLFARRLQSVLKVPVGVICSAWGGTSILGWMPEEAINRTISAEEKAAIIAINDVAKNHPALLYNGMIAPMEGFAARGFIWYQGCANVAHPEPYARLLRSMIQAWRTAWGNNEMAFYAVELAPYRYGRDNEQKFDRATWVEQVNKMMASTPHTALIPTGDVGDRGCIHPAKKQQVGDRLATMALKHNYALSSLEPEAPAIAKVEYRDGRAYIKTTSPLGPVVGSLYGFEIAGGNKRFHEARAAVNSRTGEIEVWSDHVPDPIAIRYAFHNYPERQNWRNWLGIPALPCRTDDWPLTE